MNTDFLLKASRIFEPTPNGYSNAVGANKKMLSWDAFALVEGRNTFEGMINNFGDLGVDITRSKSMIILFALKTVPRRIKTTDPFPETWTTGN